LSFSRFVQKIDSKAKKRAFLRDKINDFRQLVGSNPNAKLDE